MPEICPAWASHAEGGSEGPGSDSGLAQDYRQEEKKASSILLLLSRSPQPQIWVLMFQGYASLQPSAPSQWSALGSVGPEYPYPQLHQLPLPRAEQYRTDPIMPFILFLGSCMVGGTDLCYHLTGPQHSSGLSQREKLGPKCNSSCLYQARLILGAINPFHTAALPSDHQAGITEFKAPSVLKVDSVLELYG